jgi:hypothetical protein
MRALVLYAAGVAAALLASLPGLSLAQSGPAGPTQADAPVWTAESELRASRASGQTWSDASLGLRRPSAPLGRLREAGLAVRSRPGLTDVQVRTTVQAPAGWLVELAAAPGATTMPRAGLRVTHVRTVRQGETTLVPSVGLDLRQWDGAGLAGVTAGLEVYPGEGNWWGTGGLSAGSLEGDLVGGGFASLRARLGSGADAGASEGSHQRPRMEVWALAGGGREVEAARSFRTTTVAAGIAVPVARLETSTLGLDIGVEQERRQGQRARTGLIVRLVQSR